MSSLWFEVVEAGGNWIVYIWEHNKPEHLSEVFGDTPISAMVNAEAKARLLVKERQDAQH